MKVSSRISDLEALIGGALNQAALDKGGSVEQRVGDFLSINEMLSYAQKCVDYYCEMTGFDTKNITITYSGETPLDVEVTITLEEKSI